MEVEQERNTKVLVNRIISKVAWAKGVEQAPSKTGEHRPTSVRVADPTATGRAGAALIYAQVASAKGKERAGSVEQRP